MRPCSKVRSKVSGRPNVFAIFRQAPPLVMFWTVQEMTDERRGTMILALRWTRVRLKRSAIFDFIFDVRTWPIRTARSRARATNARGLGL